MRLLWFLLGLLGANACSPSVDCLWNSNKNCFCLEGPVGWSQYTCPPCDDPVKEERIRCGCYPDLNTGLCSEGICVLKALAEASTYLEVQPLSKYTLQLKRWSFDGVFSFAQSMTWAYAIKPCLCLSNQLMTQDCVLLDIYQAPLCSVCPPGQFCHGTTRMEQCAEGSYCFDGKSVVCDALKAQQCPVQSMSQYSIGCPAGFTYSQSLCTPCPMGTYLAASSFHTATACTPCEVGFFQEWAREGVTSSGNCAQCQRGTYTATTGRTICETCVSGAYQDNMQATTCKDCMPGTKFVNVGTTCVTCDVGEFSAMRQATVCSRCAVGTYASARGSSECVACAAAKTTQIQVAVNGGIFLAGTGKTSASDCVDCPPGYVVCGPDDAFCTAKRECAACPTGYYCPGLNQMRLYVVARPGYYFAFVGNSTHDRTLATCTACDFANKKEFITQNCSDGAPTECAPCKTSTTLLSYVVGACTPLEDTRLEPCGGNAKIGSLCNPCLPGTFNDTTTSGCVPCAANYVSEDGRACVPCPVGFVSGPGSSLCVRQCAAGQFASDGVACRSLGLAAERVVAEASRLTSFAAMAYYDGEGRDVLVATNRDRGLLWWINTAMWSASTSMRLLSPLTALIPWQTGGYMLGDANGTIRVLSYDPQGGLQIKSTRSFPRVDVGGLVQVAANVFVMSDRRNHVLWLASTFADSTERLLRGSVQGDRSTSFQDTRGYFCRPTSVAVQPDDSSILVVLDDFGVWTLDWTADTTTRGVCGGGSVGDVASNPNYYADRVGISCKELDFVKLKATSMTTGFVRGKASVVLAMAHGGVSFFRMGDWWLYVLTNAQPYEHVFFGARGDRLFAAAMTPWVVVVEMGLQGCLCDAGFYCLNGQTCIQAPAGTFAPSWSLQPILCKTGTVGTGPGATSRSTGCQLCAQVSGQTVYTTVTDGATNCVPKCPSDTPFYDKTTQSCKAACSTAGQYMSELSMMCTQCPHGTYVLNGIRCLPCPAGTHAVAMGVCEPCPPSSTTYFEGADECTTTSLVPTSTNNNRIAAVTDLAATGSGVVWGGSATQGLWRFSGASSLVLDATPLVFGLLDINDDESVIYSAAIGGHCLYAYDFTRQVVLAGQCNAPGETDGPKGYASFTRIESLAYMHVSGGHTPVLFVASYASACASIRAVSLFDLSVSTFASYDDARGNRVLLDKCVPSMKISTARSLPYFFLFVLFGGFDVEGGSRGKDLLFYYFYNEQRGGSEIVQTRNDGKYATKPLIATTGSAEITALCVKPGNGSTMLMMAYYANQVRIATVVGDGIQSVVEWPEHAATKALVCMGRWYWGVSDDAQVWAAERNEPGCLGGYVDVQGVCYQLGRGQFLDANGNNVVPCKSGTYGSRAGAWSSAFCKECPHGSVSSEGALECKACPLLSWAWGSACVAKCPAGTYQQPPQVCANCPSGMESAAGSTSVAACKPCAAGSYANASSGGLCVRCPAGFSSQIGSHHCVVACPVGQCSRRDNEQQRCEPLSENWKMLTSIQLMGSSMRTVTVSRNRHVFFSDGNAISYFRDDCGSQENNAAAANAATCQKTGRVLLPKDSNMWVDRSISSLVITRDYVNAQMTQRYLYAASTTTHSIYRLTVELPDTGEVTIPVPVWKSMAGGGYADFVDGTFAAARFNTPSELEISPDDATLYVSDFGNHRIRVLDLQTQTVRTLLGNGMPCWRTGLLDGLSLYPSDQATLDGALCDGYVGARATAQRPMGMGLSRDGSRLYVSMFDENSVGVVDGPEFRRFCSMDPNRMQNSGQTESCRTDLAVQGRSCFLWKPFDVAVTDQSLFVAVTNGVTKIDLQTLACKQVSGALWETQSTLSSGFVDGELLNETCATSRVYNPFKMVFASDTGIMYVADMSNGAVRRIFIDGRCMCPEGSIYLENARACYDPTQRWATRMLVDCSDQEGYFALEGDTRCRSCNDEAAGVYVVKCILWWQKQAATAHKGGIPFSKVAANPRPLGSSFSADWFGVSSADGNNRVYDDIVNDQRMEYAMKESSVPRPQTLRYQPETREWLVEHDPRQQPTVHVPGLWYPCDVLSLGETKCSSKERVLGGEWAYARDMGMRLGARLCTDKLACVQSAPDQHGQMIWGWSRFMLLVDGQARMQHVQEKVPPKLTTTIADVSLYPTSTSNNALRYVGWPAHFECPAGFVWTLALPNSYCLSCLAGAYSEIIYARQGPYECNQCFLGKYNPSIAASACRLCPSGTFANVTGSLQCAQCTKNYNTTAGAQAESQCDPCEPGTGGCKSCVPGKWQDQAAQDECEYCDPGSYSNTHNATKCTKCGVGTFQAMAGMMACERCPRGTYAPMTGATACGACDNTNCVLAVGGVCGTGCGVNRYWDESTRDCALCPLGTLNTDSLCALDATGCWSPRAGMFYSAQSQTVQRCAEGSGPNANFDGCVLCAPGYHFSQEGWGCIPCAGGQYSTGSGMTTCLQCAAGSFSAPLGYPLTEYTRLYPPPAAEQGQTTACTLCPPGKHSAQNGSDTCEACQAGSYASEGGAMACVLCKNGTYGNSVGAVQDCTARCQEGEFSGAGASACVACVGGVVVGRGVACTPCGLGHYGTVGAWRCIQCSPGLVNLWDLYANSSSVCQRCAGNSYAAPNGSACWPVRAGFVPNVEGTGEVACAAGTYRGLNDSASVCLLCAPGYVAPSTASKQCVACGVGEYAQVGGMTACWGCGPGLVADMPGSARCRVCEVGHRAVGNRICEACPNDTYSVDGVQCWGCIGGLPYAPSGSSTCLPCPDWTTMSARGKCEGCATGSFMAFVSWRGYFCDPCPDGYITPNAGGECRNCSHYYVPNAARDACVACPSGQQRVVGGAVCGACGVGTYSASMMARCVACSAGSFADGMGASACKACKAGAYGSGVGASTCKACDAGTFAAQDGQTQCAVCGKNEYAPTNGSVACMNRTRTCAVGQYVMLQTDKPHMNNTCVMCEPCKSNDFLVTPRTVTSWLQQSSESLMQTLCPGNTVARMYQCVSYAPEAGYYFVGSSMAAGASPDGDGVGFTFSKERCTDLDQQDPELGRFMYVRGKVPGCFLGCKYGLLNTDTYTLHVSGNLGDDPFNNVFLPLALAWEQEMCRSCPQSPCGFNLYRPKLTAQCGPICENGASCGDGCTGTCRPPPEGAVTMGGSKLLGSDICEWQCGFGWHISDDATGCRNCTAERPEFCPPGFVLVDTSRECLRTSTSNDLCRRCEEIVGGRATGWGAQGCVYECMGSYFSVDATSCLPCDIYNNQTCPPGFYRDYVGCLEKGRAPLCRPCLTPTMEELDLYAFSFTSDGGFDARNCSAQCGVGFHTFSVKQLRYVEQPLNVFDLQCVRCEPQRDSITCHGACQPGQFRNKSIADGLQKGACVRCLTSADCGPGQYALACAGNGSANSGCIPCDDSSVLLQPRQFVPYALRLDPEKNQLLYPLMGDCPTVCKPNFVISPTDGTKCVSCASLLVPNTPNNYDAPRHSDFVFAHWNATPGVVWWDPLLSPPSLVRYATANTGKPRVSRAGICWACPYGEGTRDGDVDLCELLPGFGRSVAEDQKLTRVKIPVLGPDVFLVMQEPAITFVDITLLQRRRLLHVNASSSSITMTASVSKNRLCSYGYYKPKAGFLLESCYSCPYGTSTISEGAISIRECLCNPGWYPRNATVNMGCLPCPADTFLNVSTCSPCPVNETTFGQTGSTTCACAWGLMRLSSQEKKACAPCPANTHCRPCAQGEDCAPSRVQLTRCFLGASSPPGSTRVENCTCTSGLVALKRASGGEWYCSPTPPHSLYDAELRRISCAPGWRETWLRGQLESCSLCDLGMYASLPLVPLLHCTPCPLGTYADTRDAIGNCTSCAFSLSTKSVGTTDVRGCGCPPPLIAAGGGCLGCRADQYFNGASCSACPPHSISKQADGMACQCAAGYVMSKAAVCVPCPVGTYSGFAGAVKCSECPRGSSTLSLGSSSVSQCTVCAKDYVWMGKLGCMLQSLIW